MKGQLSDLREYGYKAKPTNRCQLLGMLPKGSAGAEIGVLKGRFSQRMVWVVKPRLLYMIDAWCRIPGTNRIFTDHWHFTNLRKTLVRLRPEIAQGIVRPICALATEAPSLVPDGSLDWVYIDGDHSYEGCLFDLRAWWEKVKPGGYIMGHDYHPEREPGVPKTVDEFAVEKGLTAELTVESIPSFWFKR